MKYFAMAGGLRSSDFMSGTKNSIYTEVFPDEDFAETGYWFWLKSPNGHGFDVKAFDKAHVYVRATELVWQDNATFKRFVHDLPIAPRCVAEGEPGPEIKVRDTAYEYFAGCRPYKQGQLGTALNSLDAPVLMDTEGNIGKVWTRVLHYRYNCDNDFRQCRDEEQFYLANGYGEWQWKHYKNGALVNSTLISQTKSGSSSASLPCQNSFEPRPSIRQIPVAPSRDSN
jgi:hypothetical protein